MGVRPLEMLELKLEAFKITCQKPGFPGLEFVNASPPPSAGGQTEL